MTLKARAHSGAPILGSRRSVAPVFGLVPSTGGTSAGEGSRSTTASSSGWTPLLRSALPQSTGVTARAIVRRRTAARISAAGGSGFSR